MVKKTTGVENLGCCKVEAVINVDERGQMVLPKDLRDKAGIKAGDKLAVATVECGEKSYCVILIKIDSLSGILKEILGPAMKELQKE